MFYLGLGKTLFNSSACLLKTAPGGPEIELILSERILRKKATGVWPEAAIRLLESPLRARKPAGIAENRDVHAPTAQEERLNERFPFYDYLHNKGLSQYSRRFNKQIQFVTHHRCHAMAAVAISPFRRCLIVVMDGAGSQYADFPKGLERKGTSNPEAHEECSVYLHNQGKLKCVHKRWRTFRASRKDKERLFTEGAGLLYETAAEYIFNSKRAAGKVMGLASFGKATAVKGRWTYQENLNWKKAFQGTSKHAWEESRHLPVYTNIAASVQADFEHEYLGLLESLRRKYPDYEDIILTGGCALNCTANGKLLERGLFRHIYVPPFPGDECIALGAAASLYFARHPWKPVPFEKQHGYWGPRSSIPTERAIRTAFSGYKITKSASITKHCAALLAKGQILAWFQGRSESGPRALGNRSILASPLTPGLKDHLNRNVKFREAFRPYGASILHSQASRFFSVPKGFDTPYMSFAVKPLPAEQERLKEICHVDGTSRIQTVRPGQNKRFHTLLKEFGNKTGLPCLLNTSLNVMGEPIVETVEDAKRFLESTPVDGLAIGDFFVQRRR